MSRKTAVVLLLLFFLLGPVPAFAQPCTQLGQTPSTAFPVCGTTVFTQNTVPICSTNDLVVPGCSGTGTAIYQNKNPYFYKFTCYVAGTLGFLITPLAANEDYDWQLYDITGHDPNDIFTNTSIIVTGNWAGTYGATGASASGVNFIQCASSPGDNEPTFAQMPTLVVGHTYLLMVSHFSDTQSGYTLSFGGGTGVITDPAIPHMQTVKPDCDGKTLTLKLNKKIRCNSLSPTGSEFSISPAVTTVTGVSTTTCSSGFDFDEITLTLASALPNGNYDLVINNGTDGNTLLDYCENAIPAGEKSNFEYFIPIPIFADSVGSVGCAPQEVNVYFPKKIDCSTIAADGSDFAVTGPSPVTVIGASGNCVNGKSDVITVRFASPVYVKGTYQVTLKAGTDGSTAIDECGVTLPVHSRPFTAVDTVSAAFTYTIDFDCRSNTLHFTHDGAHDVNSWTWTFNGDSIVHTQLHTMDFPSSGDNSAQLIVNNGICRDTVTTTISFDNEVKAGFEMPPIICPEDPLNVINTCSGQVDAWHWSFDRISTSTDENPGPVFFPQNNREMYYNIKLVAINNTLNCRDSVKQMLRVLSNCFIAVPTAFTPNGDGLNDYLSPNNAFKADNLLFSVFNRWGQPVFTTRNWQDKWDGKIKGVPQGSGVYVWFLSYTHRDSGQKIFQKGTVTLIR